MANTRDIMGEQACLDALVANTLTYFEDDGVIEVAPYALRGRTALADVVLSKCKSVNTYGFAGCTNLESVDILGTGTIYDSAFSACSKLKHFVIRGETLTTLDYLSAFSNTPISGGDGAVYVDEDLVSSYRANSTWRRLSIFPLDAYPLTVFETISDSWSDIITACSNGTYDTKYAVGDVKSIVVDGTTYYMRLVAKDTDVLASDGETTAPTTWIMDRKLYGTMHRMDARSVAGNEWATSELRGWLISDVLPLLPSEVRSAIKGVNKYTDTYPSGASAISKNNLTTDTLWIPSAGEILGGTSYETMGPNYASTFYISSNTRIKCRANNYYSNEYWLRTASSLTNSREISASGSQSTYAKQNSIGVAFGFCI